MKKFIIACTVIVMFAAGWLFLSSRIGMTFQWESLRKTSVETFTKVEGKTILVDQGQGLDPRRQSGKRDSGSFRDRLRD